MILSLETVDIPAGSVEYIEANVYARENLTGSTPELALVADGSPVTWLPAAWNGPISEVGLARTTTAQTLAAGTYTVRVRITDNPEAPIRDAYTLTVY